MTFSRLLPVLLPALLGAVEPLPSLPPVPALEATKTFHLERGFTMDLLAAEPLVASPVAMCYDENGIAYVVEMLDYPYTDRATHQAWKENTTDAPIGRIRQLIDRDGDGVFDESHIFAEGLSWPTGICAWKGGVFVTATPDVWYFKDTDGDHRADVREKVLTGFRKFNVQAVMNGPLWGLDNRITFTGGTNGGMITRPDKPGTAPLKIARHDVRLDPRTGAFDLLAGGARFGHAMDDWGNRFLCNIRNPGQHVVFDGTLSARNPLLPLPNPVHDARVPGDQLPVRRISPLEPWREVRARRWTAEGVKLPRSELVAGGVYTSASGITIYRGAAYPDEFRGQAFVAEVANNLVQRQTVVADGVTFRMAPADESAEFLASTDLWFRPVNFVNAPDGTLHVVDMYRETIEHPWSIPDDIRERLDLERGRDRGRIYRLAPPGFRVPKPPRLGAASTADLVATLANPHGWWRDTAQRLLMEREDPAAVGPLRAMARDGSEIARLHALWALDGLGALRDEDLLRTLEDSSAGLREQAVRLAPSRLTGSAELRRAVLGLANDAAIRVRYQVAFVAGGLEGDDALAALQRILARDAGDLWVRAAALSAPPDRCAALAERWLADPGRPAGDGAREVTRLLAYVTGARNRSASLGAVAGAMVQAPSGEALTDAFWTGMGDGLRQAGRTLRLAFADEETAPGRAVTALLAGARLRVLDRALPISSRVAAARMVGQDAFASARPVLAGLLRPDEPPAVQVAAVRALATSTDSGVAPALLAGWANLTPAVREEVLGALLARRERIGPLLAAIERGDVAAGHVPPARRTQLMANPDAALKARAAALFGGGVSASRREAVAAYQAALALPGDPVKGARVFDQLCANCHRLRGRGVEIGPNLETVRGWDREKLLLNILDPNREVAANFLAYVIELRDGGAVSGLITDESPGSIKVRRIGAPEEVILRQNIRAITSSSQSLMPEGLEAAIPVPAMADLLAHLLAP